MLLKNPGEESRAAAEASRSSRRASALFARGVFERHQTARQIGLNELSEPRFGRVNTASSGL